MSTPPAEHHAPESTSAISQSPVPATDQPLTPAAAAPENGTAAAAATTSALPSNPPSPPAAAQESEIPGKDDASKATDPSEAASERKDDRQLPAVAAARVASPASRTSTPPLATAAKKKFSSVSVTKEFLSKAASPVPSQPKTVRPAAVAAPTQASTSKLLSTKLTTVPSSKPSTSPKPPPVAATTVAASPWAKPVVPDGPTPLQHPAPTRSGLPPVAMGSGQGLGAAARRAWGPITGGGHGGDRDRRLGGGPGGLSRDFPTAKEVAEGKRKAMQNAQAIAQAEAAHNQAILDDLNVFTHIEPNAHRWDEEEDEEDVIDFGDRPEARPLGEEPVSKQERFVEDFDRSWPPRNRSPTRPGMPGRSDRVLFNASSNRLESYSRQAAAAGAPLPTRVMSRDPPPPSNDRPLPPHLANDGGRMLPPHMAHPAGSDSRPSWRSEAPHAAHQPREPPQRQASLHDGPAHHPPRPDFGRPQAPVTSRQPSLSAAPATAAPAAMAPPAPAAQAPPPVTSPTSTTAALPTAPVEAVVEETQAAEMHSAAEKARLRRMAEEAEREAAAERARQKAREIAERFGGAQPAKPQQSAAAPPPGIPKVEPKSPQITIAARPRLPDVTQPVLPSQVPVDRAADRATSWRRTGPVPEADKGGSRRFSANEPRPDAPRDLRRQRDNEARPFQAREGVLMGRDGALARDGPNGPQGGLPAAMRGPAPVRDGPPHAPLAPHEAPRVQPEQAFAQEAVPKVEHTEHIAAPIPQSSKREANIDTMLARLQAAMAKARSTPPPGEEEAPTMEAKSAPALATSPAVSAPGQVPASAPPAAARNEAPPKPRKVVSPPKLPFLPPDYFDATQGEIPRSPPPAWRTYTVKPPKAAPPNRGAIQRWRLKHADGPWPWAPKGWMLTFEPAIELLTAPTTLPDLLLPQPIGRRFARNVDTGPIVSISPRRLVVFQRKPKRRPTLESRPEPPKMDAGRAVAEPSQTAPSLHAAPEIASKGKISIGRAEAVNTHLPMMQAMADKPAVRFMVSSELDGDSLLEEVNKMSLEHIGEADDKSKVPEEKPRTPPPMATQVATSPNATQGPWAKSALAYNLTSPARGDPPPDHLNLKSVWEGAGEAAAAATAPPSAPSQPETPLYPSLNSPAVQPDPANQALKAGYAMSQTSSSFSARSFGQGGYGQFVGSGATSPDGGMGVQYGLIGRNPGSNGYQQGGLWAAPFGNTMATPAAAAYNFKNGGEQKPTGVGAFGKESGYSGDMRYSQGGSGFQAAAGTSGYAGYPTQQYRPQQAMYGLGGGGSGYGHGFGQQMAAPRAASGHGHVQRFPNVGTNGNSGETVGYPSMGYDPSSYYSGQQFVPGGYGGAVGGNAAPQQQQQQHNHHQQQGARGAIGGRKMW